MDLSFIPYSRRTWASFFRMLRNFPSSACFVCTSMLFSKVIQEVVTATNKVGGKVIWLTSGPSSLLPTWLEKPAIGQAGEQKKQALVRGCFQASSHWWPCSCERTGPLWKLQHFPQTPKSTCIWLGSSVRLMYLSVHWVPFPRSLLVPSPSNKHALSSKSLRPMGFENHSWRGVTMFSGNVRPGSQWMSCRGGPRLKYPGKGNCHLFLHGLNYCL